MQAGSYTVGQLNSHASRSIHSDASPAQPPFASLHLMIRNLKGTCVQAHLQQRHWECVWSLPYCCCSAVDTETKDKALASQWVGDLCNTAARSCNASLSTLYHFMTLRSGAWGLTDGPPFVIVKVLRTKQWWVPAEGQTTPNLTRTAVLTKSHSIWSTRFPEEWLETSASMYHYTLSLTLALVCSQQSVNNFDQTTRCTWR